MEETCINVVPETKFYKWEGQETLKTSQVRTLLAVRINAVDGMPREAYVKVREAFDTLWSKKGFDTFPTKKLKAMLIAAARDVGWVVRPIDRRPNKPKQPADPNFRTCPTCRETKPKEFFTRVVSQGKIRQFKLREDSKRTTVYEQCNYCASPKRKSIAPKRTTPSVAKLRKQITHKLMLTRRLYDCEFRDLKIRLLEECRWRLKDYLARGVRAPDEWYMLLTQEEDYTLEEAYLRAVFPRRKPDVF